MIDIKITDSKLDIAECLNLAKDLESGGIATFIELYATKLRINQLFD